MKTILGLFAAGAITLSATIAFPTVARADGLAIAPAALSKSDRSTLEKEIAEARAAHPEAFDAVKGVQGYRKAVYSKFRNPRPHVGAELRAIGPNALMPMLDELAFNAVPQGDASDDDMNALKVGLVEAVGALRDPKSRAVLHAIFEASSANAGLKAAAARAIGKLGGDTDLALLEKHQTAGDAAQLAAIEGLAECRRIEAANDLAALFVSTTDEGTAKALAKAAGVLGSSWAWKTLGASAEKTGLEVRETLAKALVPQYARWHDTVRLSIGKAVLMLDHPVLPDLITAQRATADTATQKDLDALGEIVASHLNH
jgi:hypothetical protein